MAKTLVVPNHAPGPYQNGFGGCHARYGHEGMCPGVGIAKWLNGLGEDDEPFTTLKSPNGEIITIGRVRDNWLRESDHIVAVEPLLAKLRAEKRRASAELRLINCRLKAIGGL